MEKSAEASLGTCISFALCRSIWRLVANRVCATILVEISDDNLLEIVYDAKKNPL